MQIGLPIRHSGNWEVQWRGGSTPIRSDSTGGDADGFPGWNGFRRGAFQHRAESFFELDGKMF